MIVVEPSPTRYSLVVIVEDPLKTFNISKNNAMQLFRLVVFDMELRLH